MLSQIFRFWYFIVRWINWIHLIHFQPNLMNFRLLSHKLWSFDNTPVTPTFPLLPITQDWDIRRRLSIYFLNPCETKNIINTCFDTLYTNFMLDPYVNFDLEFLNLPKGAIVAFVSMWKSTSTTLRSYINRTLFHEVLFDCM